MCERTSVVTAKVAVIHHGSAMRNVISAAQGHASAVEIRAPRVEAPAESAKHPQADAHAEADSQSHHQTHRNRRHIKARIRNHQRPEHHPRIVIRNRYQKWIDRRNHDRALLNHHSLLRRGHQHMPLLRREAVGLDRVHHVFRLVVIRVTQLRRPRRVLRQIVQDGRELRQTLDRRVPRHPIGCGRPLIGGQCQVCVQPGIRRGNLVRICCGNQYLGHQRVRIQRERRYQLIQLIRVQRNVRGHRLRVQIQFYGCRNQQRGKHQRQRLAHGLIQGSYGLGVHRLSSLYPIGPT
jgi:hypothetical protein